MWTDIKNGQDSKDIEADKGAKLHRDSVDNREETGVWENEGEGGCVAREVYNGRIAEFRSIKYVKNMAVFGKKMMGKCYF